MIPLQDQYSVFETEFTEEEALKLFKKEYVEELKREGKLKKYEINKWIHT